jgi:hypothetical protein
LGRKRRRSHPGIWRSGSWWFARSWLGKRDHRPGNKYQDRFTYPTYPRSIS